MKKFFILMTFSLVFHDNIQATDSETTRDSDICDELVEQFDNYLVCLPNHLGCECCQFFHACFNTRQNQYVTKQKQAVTKIKTCVLEQKTSDGKLLVVFDETILAYEDFYGPIFDKNVRRLLSRSAGRKNRSVEAACSYCLADLDKIMISGCGHMSICEPCLKENNVKICTICEKRIDTVYPKSNCLVCDKAEATCLHFGCDHLDTCETCHINRAKKSCLVCGSAQGSTIMKL